MEAGALGFESLQIYNLGFREVTKEVLSALLVVLSFPHFLPPYNDSKDQNHEKWFFRVLTLGIMMRMVCRTNLQNITPGLYSPQAQKTARTQKPQALNTSNVTLLTLG